MYELMIWMAFWIITYAPEGLHDAYQYLEAEERGRSTELSKYYSGKWHTLDGIVMAIIHLGTSALTYFYFYNWFSVIMFLVISLVVRMLIHDIFIDIGRSRLQWDFVGTCDDDDWDWWDCLMLKLKKAGINHRVILFVILIALITGYFLI